MEMEWYRKDSLGNAWGGGGEKGGRGCNTHQVFSNSGETLGSRFSGVGGVGSRSKMSGGRGPECWWHWSNWCGPGTAFPRAIIGLKP